MWESLTLTLSECSIKAGSRVGGGAERRSSEPRDGGGGFEFFAEELNVFLRNEFDRRYLEENRPENRRLAVSQWNSRQTEVAGGGSRCRPEDE